MKAIVWLLALFALAVAITLAARFDPGYVLVVLPPWRLEMSFVLAAVAMLALYGALYLLAGILRMALRLPADVRAWHRRRKGVQAEDELTRAIAAYLAGRPGPAQRLAASAYEHDRDTLAGLVAAHAALAAGDPAAARRYLDGLATEAEELAAARAAAEARLAGPASG
jgi:HemY protein